MPRKVFTETEPFKETLFLISFIKKHHKTGAYVLVFLGHFQKCLTAFFLLWVHKLIVHHIIP
jgi:late competence protein required for DNA uptake (superfamily II DNA/RNA helicase)